MATSTPVSAKKLALENAANIADQFSKLVGKTEVKKFIDFLEDNLKVSLNVKHTTFINCVTSGSYKSAYEFYSNDNEAKKHFGKSRGEYRIEFDCTFENGKKFKYFSLNAGNMGMPVWGHYCMVFHISYFASDATVVLMNNSLHQDASGKFHYFDDAKKVEVELVKIEISTIPDANKLIVLKKECEIDSSRQEEWSELVCACKDNHAETDYLELITHQDCVLKDNFAVRMLKSDIEKIYLTLSDRVNNIVALDGWEIMRNEFDEFKSIIKSKKIPLNLI